MPEAMDELEDRRYIFKDSEFLIEEVNMEGNYFRRLIIVANVGVIQN